MSYMFIWSNSFQIQDTIHARDIRKQLIMLIALTKNQLGTLMEMWSAVSGCT